jgi:hypothetical protein
MLAVAVLGLLKISLLQELRVLAVLAVVEQVEVLLEELELQEQ